MKKLLLLISLLPLMISCQFNNPESYKMSWIGWLIMAVIGTAVFLVFVLKKGIVDEAEEKKPVTIKGEASVDFEPIGNYIGGHPGSENMISEIVFRKNSDCCLFFYKDRSYSMPEFKFKIKVKSFKNITVEDLSSIENKLESGNVTLTSGAGNIIRKKKQLAFITIDWADGQTNHSTIFSFEGNDAMQKASTARENLLRAIN